MNSKHLKSTEMTLFNFGHLILFTYSCRETVLSHATKENPFEYYSVFIYILWCSIHDRNKIWIHTYLQMMYLKKMLIG